MDIEGTYTLQAPPEEVWGCLKDQQVLQRTIPGVERIEALSEEKYAGRLQLPNDSPPTITALPSKARDSKARSTV